MRTARIKAPSTHLFAYYHCTSRIVNKEPRIEDAEKETFRALMRRYERFCGVRILTYCILSNHFHILLEVPAPPKAPLSDQEFLERLSVLPASAWARDMRDQFERFQAGGHLDQAQQLKLEVCSLMWDVSSYMKLLKQTFSQGYNRRHGRRGTLWEERFGSVLVEGIGTALQTMAAYIDLNPVRAGLVKDPKDYRWSGYGEAVSGGKLAYEGLEKVMMEKGLEGYRSWMYCYGVIDEGLTEDGKPKRLGFSADEVRAVLAAKGKLPVWEYVRLRVRYFAAGKVLGSQAFVRGLWEEYRKRNGLVRKLEGTHALVGVQEELFCFQGARCAPAG